MDNDNIVKRFIKVKELRDVNIGLSSSDFNEDMDGGGHGLFKKENKWNYTADYLTGRLGLVSTFLRLLEQSAAGTDVDDWGQLWVLDNAPNELWFTDDAGNSMLIASLTNNITVIDADDVNIADALNIITATEVEAALQEIKALVDTNVIHISSDGSDHSKVGDNETAIGLNTTHRGSDGSDHSKVGANETAIGLNTTHRGLSNNPHSVDAADVGLSGGVTTTFLIANGDTVTVVNGIITSVAP